MAPITQDNWLSTALICSSIDPAHVLASRIKPLGEAMTAAGKARTAQVEPGDNLAIHRALNEAQAGDMIVVDADGDVTAGYFGDLLAEGCRQKGLAGVVIDGAVRDSAALRAMGFPVFCAGVCPAKTQKKHHGAINMPITCGNVQISPGDLIIADQDGVVALDHRNYSDIYALRPITERLLKKEEIIRVRIKDGETTLNIFSNTADN
ncbi:MAG: RraA family protein [Hyphococcus sp.]